jgi:hypothetical protein
MTKAADWDRCFRVLGLKPGAGFKEIQAAYRRLVLRYHPDVNHTAGAPGRFREIVEAYGTILDFVRARAAVSDNELYASVKRDPVVKNMKFEELETRFKYSSSPRLRTSVLIAMEMYRGERTKKLLFEALRDENENVRLTALKILEKECCLRDIPKIFLSLSVIKNRRVRKELLHLIFKINKHAAAGYGDQPNDEKRRGGHR